MDLKHDYEFEQRFTMLLSGHADAKEALDARRERRAATYQTLDPAWAASI